MTYGGVVLDIWWDGALSDRPGISKVALSADAIYESGTRIESVFESVVIDEAFRSAADATLQYPVTKEHPAGVLVAGDPVVSWITYFLEEGGGVFSLRVKCRYRGQYGVWLFGVVQFPAGVPEPAPETKFPSLKGDFVEYRSVSIEWTAASAKLEERANGRKEARKAAKF